jgi:hypothetical protein
MAQCDRVEQLGDGLADGFPIGARVVARRSQGLLYGFEPGGVAQLGQAGATEQWTERRIAERSFVELDDMGVAAGVLVE